MDQGEPEARWYWLDEDREWKKFMKLDSDLIEIASQSGDKVVKILGGLYEADIDARAYKKVSTGFVRKIMRSTWFAEDSKVNEKGEKNCIPFMEDICQRLEEAYLTEQFGPKIPVGLDFAVILSRDGNHKQVHETIATDVIRVTRGYKNRTVREATRRRDSSEYQPREQYSYGTVPSIQERIGSSPNTANLPPLRDSPVNSRSNSVSLSPTSTRILDSAPSVRNSVFLEGYLHKLGEKFNGWDNRWFVLNADYLVYFSNKSRDKEKGRIALSAVQKCELAPPSSKHGASGTVFMLHTPKRTYQLRASSRRDAEAWVDGINKNMRGESPNAPTAPVATVEVKQVVNDDKGAVVSVRNESRPLSGDFSKQVAVNPLQQTSAPMLGPQPIPLSQLPNNSPYNNAAGNRMSMPGQSVSQPMIGQGQMMAPGMSPQPVGGQMMNPNMQPMGQMGQNQPMMMNPGMMGNQMGQNPGMMNPGMQPMNNSPGQSPLMQRPMGQMGQNTGMMGNQMNPGMPQSPMMGQNYNQPMNNSPMQSPMMPHQPMNTGTYQMAPQVNNPSIMGQGQPMTGGQNYRLSQQYPQPVGTQNTMGQMSGQGVTQPMMGQGTMSPQMGMMGQGTMNPQMGGQMMGTQNTMGQMTGQGMTTQTPSGWPPGYAPPPPSNSAGQYGNPSLYNNNQYGSPSQSPAMSQYTPSATNPFAQQVGQGGQPQYNYNPMQNTGQYNAQMPGSPSQYGAPNTGYGQQPGQYQPNPGTYGTSNQMYNYRQ